MLLTRSLLLLLITLDGHALLLLVQLNKNQIYSLCSIYKRFYCCHVVFNVV